MLLNLYYYDVCIHSFEGQHSEVVDIQRHKLGNLSTIPVLHGSVTSTKPFIASHYM